MLCGVCKGKGLCGLSRCPVTERFRVLLRQKPMTSYSGTAPSLFIGSSGYPAVRGGPLLVDDTDLPPVWLSQGLGIEDIVRLRAETIRGISKIDSYRDQIQEIAMAPRPVMVDAAFDRPVRFEPDFDRVTAPVGCSGTIASLAVLDHPPTDRAVERVTSDSDLPAGEGCTLLHQSGIDVYRITPLMTAGLLGRRRRIVPTRWAITAVDDVVSTAQKKEIKWYQPVSSIRLHAAELFGNRIGILLVPGDWRYEMIERWSPRSLWSGETASVESDREDLKKNGYSPIAGAYYSARLAVTEHLSRIQRSARVIVIRNVDPSYWAPLGTWVVREVSRRAMAAEPQEFQHLGAAVCHAALLTGFPGWDIHSGLLREMKAQKRLGDFGLS